MTNQTENITRKLENILTAVAEAGNLTNYKCVPNTNQTKGEGFSSEFFTGTVVNQDDQTNIQVAIKTAPSTKNAFFDTKVLYKNEVHFYSKVFPELDKFQRKKNVNKLFTNIPKYLAGTVESNKEFVAMENLIIENYKLLDKKEYFGSEHLEYIFKTYGRFHALSFVFKQRNPEKYKNLMKNFGDAMELFVGNPATQDLLKEGYEYALNSFDPVKEAESLAKLKKLGDIQKTMTAAKTYTGNNSCLVHGDCWSNNMLFKYKESGALDNFKLLDFQLAKDGTPVHDLSYFFYTGASKVDMDKLDHYLNLYYTSFFDFAKELQGNVNELFTFDEFKMEWKQYSPLGLLLGFHLWVVKLMDKDEILDILSKNNLPKEKYKDVWHESMRKTRETESFKERVKNICLHAVEYGIV